MKNFAHQEKGVAMRSSPYKRRLFFIKKDFQSRFILYFCLLALLGNLLATALVLVFFKGNLTSMYHNSSLVITDTALFILPAVLYTNLITIVTISLSVIAITLVVSHKIAGPLFRLETDITRIAKGDLTHTIHLRKGDQFRELAADINRMTEQLNGKIAGIQTRVERIMASAAGQGAPSGFLRDLNQLHNRIDHHFIVKKEKNETHF